MPNHPRLPSGRSPSRHFRRPLPPSLFLDWKRFWNETRFVTRLGKWTQDSNLGVPSRSTLGKNLFSLTSSLSISVNRFQRVGPSSSRPTLWYRLRFRVKTEVPKILTRSTLQREITLSGHSTPRHRPAPSPLSLLPHEKASVIFRLDDSVLSLG